MSAPGRAALAAGFVLAWSSGFIGAELAARSGGASTVLAWRFLVAAPLLLVPVLLVRHLAPTWRQVRSQLVIGLLAQGGYLGGVFLAIEQGVPAGTTALVAALQPLVATAAAGVLLAERVDPRQWAGLWIGLAGVTVVVGGDLSATATSATPWAAYLLPVGAMLSLVAATLAERRHTLRGPSATVPLVTAVAIQCAVSAVLFSGLAIARGEFAPPTGAGFAGFAVAVGWVVVLSTFGGYGLYWLVLRTSGVARVSSLLYLTPPVTLVASALLFGEPVTTAAVTGIAVCLVAVWMVQRRGAGHATVRAGRDEPAGMARVPETRTLQPCTAERP